MLEAVAATGVTRAGWLMLRLPYEVAGLFEAWLREHYPHRADRVLNRIREMRGGRLNDPRFGHRHRGEGPYAEMIGARFEAACRRSGSTPRPPAGTRHDAVRARPAGARAGRACSNGL